MCLKETCLLLSSSRVYLGFVGLCGLDELIVSRLLLLVSLHAESLMTFSQMRARTCTISPRPLRQTQTFKNNFIPSQL